MGHGQQKPEKVSSTQKKHQEEHLQAISLYSPWAPPWDLPWFSSTHFVLEDLRVVTLEIKKFRQNENGYKVKWIIVLA